MLSEVWQDFLKIVKEEAGSRVVETWLKAVSLKRWDSDAKTVYVEAPNVFVKDWIESKYRKLFQTHLGRLLHVEEPKIKFFSGSEDPSDDSTKIIPARRQIIPHQIKNALVRRSRSYTTGHLNPTYRFDTFVVGPSNSLAYAAAHAVAQEPGNLYNPLFIYGGSGLGKTHLMHAIGNMIHEKDPNAIILYQTADRFVNEFITAIRFNKMHVFQQKYRMLDVLLIDDIQFISNKDQTQEVFFHIFNVLHDAHKQIIFTSDIFPRQIKGLAERLRSRLEWGLVTDIHKPQLETKMAILKKKAASHNEILDDELAEYIARQSDDNVRQLEGALLRVIAYSSLTRQSLSLEIAHQVLGKQQKELQEEEPPINFNRITSQVCKHYSYRLSDLRSNSRSKELSLARQIAMYLMKKMTDKSLREIGTFLGRKDHSTVIHALDKIAQNIEVDCALSSTIESLEKEILR